jgi:hypothetical protein
MEMNMGKQLNGAMIFAKVKKDVFPWVDPANGQTKPIRSLKILLYHGDGTVTKESISIPPGMADPNVNEEQVYALPVTVGFSKKRQQVSYTLRSDMAPFVAPEIE